jgi:cold shock CspA family protein/ribosome-associated translation inhibitor RaiA
MAWEIESRNIPMTPRWKADIEERLTALASGHNDLIHARVTLTKNLHHRKDDKVADALVVLNLPVRHTITARKEAATFEEAIREAFDAAEIEVDKFREKRATHEVRGPAAPPFRGVISEIIRDEGYGFIIPEDGGEKVYFHRNAVHDLDFERLEDGTEITFNIEEGEKGPQANAVKPVPVTEPFQKH